MSDAIDSNNWWEFFTGIKEGTDVSPKVKTKSTTQHLRAIGVIAKRHMTLPMWYVWKLLLELFLNFEGIRLNALFLSYCRQMEVVTAHKVEAISEHYRCHLWKRNSISWRQKSLQKKRFLFAALKNLSDNLRKRVSFFFFNYSVRTFPDNYSIAQIARMNEFQEIETIPTWLKR